jgi:hypothetical protein
MKVLRVLYKSSVLISKKTYRIYEYVKELVWIMIFRRIFFV